MDDADETAYCVLGDLFVCPQVAVEYSQKHELDPSEELTLYVVHGLLHLMGYDDIEEDDVKTMREAEKIHMNHLKKKGLLLKDVI